MLEYVFPHCKRFEKQIEAVKGISRLYAYPGTPRFVNQSKIVILDSGAFGISRYNKYAMNKEYMLKLSEHYEYYSSLSNNTLCVAPDVFTDPIKSMSNFRKWHKLGLYRRITPVLQRSFKNSVNIDELKQQADIYREYSNTVCIANSGMYGTQARAAGYSKFIRYLKEELEYEWIHILGAGFNLEDISAWKDVGYFDSMDSRAYFLCCESNDRTAFGTLDPVENIRRIIKCVNE